MHMQMHMHITYRYEDIQGYIAPSTHTQPEPCIITSLMEECLLKDPRRPPMIQDAQQSRPYVARPNYRSTEAFPLSQHPLVLAPGANKAWFRIWHPIGAHRS